MMQHSSIMPSTHVPELSHIASRTHGLVGVQKRPATGSLTHAPDTQLSAVHSLKSPQNVMPPGTHAPAMQRSRVVHPSPSSHEPVRCGNAHVPPAPQTSSVHWLPSLHPGPGTHAPPEHVSPLVHALPSSHGPGAGVFTHPLAPHESVVHGFESLQPIVTHAPAQHIVVRPHVGVRWQLPLTHAAVSHGPGTHVAIVHVVY